jgi:hypothetical protein
VKGIVDPWRVVEPLTRTPEPPRDPKKKINPSEIDFDADLRVWERCLFSSKHGSIAVVGPDVTSSDAGLRALTRCLHEISTLKDGKALLAEARVGISFGEGEVHHTRLQTQTEPHATLYFVNQTFEEGMLRLVRLLNAVQRRPGAAGTDILRRWGVTPMMR